MLHTSPEKKTQEGTPKQSSPNNIQRQFNATHQPSTSSGEGPDFRGRAQSETGRRMDQGRNKYPVRELAASNLGNPLLQARSDTDVNNPPVSAAGANATPRQSPHGSRWRLAAVQQEVRNEPARRQGSSNDARGRSFTLPEKDLRNDRNTGQEPTWYMQPGSPPSGRSTPGSQRSGRSTPDGQRSGRSTPGSNGWQGYERFHQELLEELERSTRARWEDHVEQLYVIPAEQEMPAWDNPQHLSLEMILGRRIAKLVLNKPPDGIDVQDWRPKLVEVQVLMIPEKKVMLLSSNSRSKYLKRQLLSVYSSVAALRKRVWGLIKDHPLLKILPLPKGASKKINANKELRQAIGILSGLESEGWDLRIIDNPDGRHAEQHLIEYAQKHYADKIVDPPVGTRPPCYLCAVFMNERGVFRHYQNVEGEGNRVPVGNLYTKNYSGMLERLTKLGYGVDPLPIPDGMTDEARTELVASIAQGVAAIYQHVVSVKSKGDPPRTPPELDLHTPDLNEAIEKAVNEDAQRPGTSMQRW